jgi:hypothetical protein
MAQPKLNTNDKNLSPSPAARLIAAALSLFRLSYGLLVLLGFVIRSRLMNPKFRQMDENEKRQLADGEFILIIS